LLTTARVRRVKRIDGHKFVSATQGAN